MKCSLLLFVTLLVSTSVSAEVFNLTDANFDDFMKKEKTVLVKFFAPWCTHCKKAAPEFESASELQKGKSAFAKVDCTVEKGLCKRFEINGFPKFYLFNDGVQLTEFRGERTASKFSNFVSNFLKPDMTPISSNEELDKIKSENERTCLIKTKSNESDLVKMARKIIPLYKDTYYFVIATNESISPEDSMETVVVYRAGGERESFNGTEPEDFKLFLNKAAVMFLGTLTHDLMSLYHKASNGSIGILLLGFEQREENAAAILPTVKKYREDLIILTIPMEGNTQVAESLGLPDETVFPAFIITSSKDVYAHPTQTAANATSIDEFIHKFLIRELEPLKKSQPIPEKETEDGLTTLVGKTLDLYISKGKNMLIYFYAPWCGFCRKTLPIFTEFAKAHASEDLIVAKLDATANYFGSTMFKVDSYPTIYFVTPGAKEVILFEGDRSVDGYLSFVKKHMKKVEPVKDKEDKYEENKNEDL